MSKPKHFMKLGRRTTVLLALVLIGLMATDSLAQRRRDRGRDRFDDRGRGGRGGLGDVGGIAVDAKGMLRNAGAKIDKKILADWRAALGPQQGDLARKIPMRKISLRGLQAAIAKRQADFLQEHILKFNRPNRSHPLFDHAYDFVGVAVLVSRRTDESKYFQRLCGHALPSLQCFL